MRPLRSPALSACVLLSACTASRTSGTPPPDPGHSPLTDLGSRCEDPAPTDAGLIFASPYTTGKFALYQRNFLSPAPTLLVSADADLRMPAPSPDGQSVAFISNTRGGWDLFLTSFSNSGRSHWTLVTATREDEATPAWSPDGNRLAWSVLSATGGSWQLRLRESDGTTRDLGSGFAPAWHPDGRRLVCQRSPGPGKPWTLVSLDVATGEATDLLASEGAGGITPAWTRDGRWVLYARLRPAVPDEDPVPGDLWAVSADGVRHVRLTATDSSKWSPREIDGGRFAYCRRAGDTVDLWMSPLQLP